MLRRCYVSEGTRRQWVDTSRAEVRTRYIYCAVHRLSDGFNVEPRLSIAHQSAPISRLDSTRRRASSPRQPPPPVRYFFTYTHNNAKTSLQRSITLVIIARDIIVCYCAPLITHLCFARRYETNQLSRSIGEHYRFHS